MLVLSLLIHCLTLANAAPPFTPPALTLTLTNPSHTNTTPPHPLPLPPSLHHLPPCPWYYTTPSTPVILKFYSYGVPLPPENLLGVLGTALRDVNAQLHPETLVPDRVLRYRSGKVYLLMEQKGQMTWEVFEKVVWGLMHFGEAYARVEFDFDVGEFGMERAFGTGVLGGL